MKQEFYPTDMEDRVCTNKYLVETCPDLGRSHIQKLLKSGQALVNGQGAKVNYTMVGEDRIEPEMSEVMEPEIDAEPTDPDILYEDQDVVLISKSKGMMAHPTAGHYSYTLVNDLMYHCRDQLSGISGVIRPGIMYQIDMDTTGVVIACRNDMAHSSIAAQLEEHSIARRYQAVIHGVIAENEGTADAPIGHHPVECKGMSISYQNGKDTVTHYRVLNRFRQYARVECRLEIGRTHQIHVHTTSIRHPLLKDTVHGPARRPISRPYGQTLHAGILGFIHPGTGEYMEFIIPLPEYFGKLLRALDRTRI